jgi:Phosphotransferase enzyme family
MSLREDVAVGWEALVGRLGKRSDVDLSWETELLRHLDREGMTVPLPIPTTDGRRFVGVLVVMTYVEGEPAETEADWHRVADTLRELHRLTRGWPQRPGWRSSTDLLHAETGTSTSPTSTWRCHTTPPVSTTRRTTLPRKHGPHGKRPSAGTPAGPTSSQSSGSPKFERSERRR